MSVPVSAAIDLVFFCVLVSRATTVVGCRLKDLDSIKAEASELKRLLEASQSAREEAEHALAEFKENSIRREESQHAEHQQREEDLTRQVSSLQEEVKVQQELHSKVELERQELAAKVEVLTDTISELQKQWVFPSLEVSLALVWREEMRPVSSCIKSYIGGGGGGVDTLCCMHTFLEWSMVLSAFPARWLHHSLTHSLTPSPLLSHHCLSD